MTLRCQGLAQKLGDRHNKNVGVSPLAWLDHFGTSLNLGSGLKARDRPLPLICRASPGDRSMTAFEDGRHCPSLQSFLEVSVEEVTIQLVGKLEEVSKEEGGYCCRLRMVGNAMSRPPLALGELVFQPGLGTFSLAKSGDPSTLPPTLYPVHHDLETTIILLEV